MTPLIGFFNSFATKPAETEKDLTASQSEDLTSQLEDLGLRTSLAEEIFSAQKEYSLPLGGVSPSPADSQDLANLEIALAALQHNRGAFETSRFFKAYAAQKLGITFVTQNVAEAAPEIDEEEFKILKETEAENHEKYKNHKQSVESYFSEIKKKTQELSNDKQTAAEKLDSKKALARSLLSYQPYFSENKKLQADFTAYLTQQGVIRSKFNQNTDCYLKMLSELRDRILITRDHLKEVIQKMETLHEIRGDSALPPLTKQEKKLNQLAQEIANATSSVPARQIGKVISLYHEGDDKKKMRIRSFLAGIFQSECQPTAPLPPTEYNETNFLILFAQLNLQCQLGRDLLHQLQKFYVKASGTLSLLDLHKDYHDRKVKAKGQKLANDFAKYEAYASSMEKQLEERITETNELKQKVEQLLQMASKNQSDQEGCLEKHFTDLIPVLGKAYDMVMEKTRLSAYKFSSPYGDGEEPLPDYYITNLEAIVK